MAINSKGTAALLYEKYLAAPADQWETHIQTTDDGTTWDDTILARTQDSDPGNAFSLGDYMRMVSVGPHFYGAFPSTNTPGPGKFFPNGGGSVAFQRNVAADGVTLLGNDGTTHISPSVDPFFFKVEQRDVIIQITRNPLSQDEVDALRASGGLPFKDELRVIIDGYTANELGLHGPSDVLNFPSPIASLTITCTGNVPDTGAWGNGFQRFTLKYDVGFTDDSPFNFAGESLDITLTFTAGTGPTSVSTSALLTLMKLPDPFILHGDTPWLSIDLRVFSVYAGQEFFSGHPWTVSDAAGCPEYIQTVMNFISADDFDHQLTTSEDVSRLYTQRTDGLGHEVFNFALAKVHYIGKNPSPFDVRVFFRLFQAQTTTGQYDFTGGQPQTQPGQYRRGVNGAGQPIPLAGFQAGEYVTIPFFASPRINSEVSSMTSQTDTPNIKTFTPRADGGEVITFFGCWLDFNQPTRIDNTGLVVQNNVLPVHVPATNVDGPFATAAIPIQSLVRATHHCLIAEIDFTPTPIPLGKDPSNWDKLAQRNIAYSDAGSATAVTPFDIKPTVLAESPADQSPDELVIDWGSTRTEHRAQIYLPQVPVSDILALASREYFPTTNLSRIDDHTLGCRVGGITYIPIPPATNLSSDGSYAGLISIELADNLHAGEVFNVVVSQVTHRSAPVPVIPKIIPLHQLSSTNPSRILWRQPIGAFQLTIPVNVDHNALLARESNELAVLLYIGRSIPPTSRWYAVFKRYLQIVAGRVAAFGGDPGAILPSSTGIQGCDDDEGEGEECCECCEQRHHHSCMKFKQCEKHSQHHLHGIELRWHFARLGGWMGAK
jgi:hypothetical protein